MVAFEILLNGKSVYTIGVGQLGILVASVMHECIQTASGSLHEWTSVYGQGHMSSQEVAEQERGRIWPRHSVAVGDEIIIRVIETDSCDYGGPLTKAGYSGPDPPTRE